MADVSIQLRYYNGKEGFWMGEESRGHSFTGVWCLGAGLSSMAAGGTRTWAVLWFSEIAYLRFRL
jgi:hypothetical protein